jgi:uncharacterized protein (DUF1697 family)
MPTYVAFLRAVNVKPRWVKMDRLRTLLSDNGFTGVQTHLQSGNVLVTTPLRSAATLRDTLQQLLSAEFGFDIPVVVRTPEQLRDLAAAVEQLPSPLSADARVYVALVDSEVHADGAKVLDGWDRPGERALVRGAEVVLWLDVPAHSAKLTNARIERAVGSVVTTRDIKVIRTLAEKWGGSAEGE